jgi:hypothetical protein
MISKLLSVVAAVGVVTVLSVMQVCTVSAAPAASGGVDFDIPTSELSKIKEDPPAKRVVSKPKKKKKADAKSKNSATGSEAEPGGTAASAQKTPAASEPVPEAVRIHHVPYSFVVSGRRTVIQAVINSETDVQAVTCKIRVVEGGAQAVVKMAKVSGTRFTYEATLPGLTPGIPSLRYVISAIDPSGKETVSQEFVTPVTTSSIVPGWQIENTGGAFQLELKDTKKTGL